MEILTGFLIGLLGSIHCAAMCGPIALILPKSKPLLMSRLVYNSGRIITYSLLGLLFGWLGSRLEIFGLQRIISITLGIIILGFVIIPGNYGNKLTVKINLYGLISTLKLSIGKLLKQLSLVSAFGIGFLNGLLPCGLVYLGISGSIAIGNPAESMIFMAMFGLGTLPVILGASLFGGKINLTIRKKLTKLVPVFSLILAVMFILRGLNLGIPYVSPKIENKPLQAENVICH